MPALRPTSAPATALTVAVLALLPACQSQRPVGPTALEAPVLSPPAHATVEERIQYWEDRMPAMSPIDQAEALLCLGELQLEAGDARQARINFNAARNNGYLSKAEEAQAAWGVGRAYLLEQKPQRARGAVGTLRGAAGGAVPDQPLTAGCAGDRVTGGVVFRVLHVLRPKSSRAEELFDQCRG